MRMSLSAFFVIALALSFALAYADGPKDAAKDKHGLSTSPSAAIRICTVNSNCPIKAVDIPTIAPRPEDVGSIDGMIKAWYDIVTVPKGTKPDWARDHTLYTPETRFLSVDLDKNGKVRGSILDHTMYASGTTPEAKGFYEQEIHRITHTFGQTAHVYSTYESRHTKDGPVIARGVNSIELFNDGSRWWITYAQWDEERPGNPLPKELLP
jgi:hypothetical protein